MKTEKIDKKKLIESSIKIEECKGSQILILKSQYNNLLTTSICNGALNELIVLGINQGMIRVKTIPGGAFELPLATKRFITQIKPEIVIVIGCIIKGETKHYEFLASTVMNALRNISFETDTPIINGVLTTETIEQAVARAGKELNKGKDFARTAKDLQDYYLEV